MRRFTNGVPFRNSQSHELIDDACTLTSTASSFGVGFATSLTCSRSGDPYSVNTIALMRHRGTRLTALLVGDRLIRQFINRFMVSLIRHEFLPIM